MAKVLYYKYSDGSGAKVVRAYLEKDFVQADKDLGLLIQEASDCKNWYLIDVELFGE
jgi:hypothetical protein